MSSDETQDAFRSFGPRFDPAAITAIGPYKGVRYFAAGGMAWVYEARHPQFPEKRLAVKLMKQEFAVVEMMRDRFLREAQLLARIGHPHLVTVHSFGVDESSRCPYFAMDYIDGGNLAEKLEAEGPLPVQVAGELYDRVLGALAALHREGVIHRDIKPLNIFMWRSGEPMLADLGIARDTAASGALTTQHYIGSPKYSSPEQANGLRLDARSDIFSLGLSLFETLVGYHPYEDAKNVDTSSAASLIGLLAVLYRDKKPIPLEFPREIPKAVRNVIRTACEIQPDKRFPDAEAMRRALRGAMRDIDQSSRESAFAQQYAAALEWVMGNGRRLALGLAALAALAALVAGGYAGWGRLQAGNADAALRNARKALAAVAPEDAALAERVRAAGDEIERDRPEIALATADAVCGELAQRVTASLEQAVRDSAGLLGRAKYAVEHAQVGSAAWQSLDALARDEARRAPRSGSESACDAPLRLEEYSHSLRDSTLALGAALADPAFKANVTALRERVHAPERAVDQKLLADGDAKFAAGDAAAAFELYTRAEVDARAAELSERYVPVLRDVAAAPEFAGRRSAVSSALTRIAKLGSLSDADALAAELEPATKEAAAALDGVRSDVNAALADADQALARAKQSGVPAERLAPAEAQLASARSDLEQSRFSAAFGVAKATRDDLERLATRMTEGAASAKQARAAALAKREEAVAAGAGERTLAKGDELLARADKLEQAGNPADASDVLASAATEFGTARTTALGTAGKIAAAVRERASSEKKKASELGATAADLAPGEEAERLGESALAQADSLGAQQHFAAARDAYQRAPLRVADERAASAREQAVGAGAGADLLAKGDASVTEARAAEAPEEALRLFATAESGFARAQHDAVAALEKTRARALRVRTDAEAARKKTLAKYSGADVSEGDREVELGNGAFEGGQLAEASEHYSLAAKAYQAAVKGAEAALAGARAQRQLAASAQGRAVRAAATEPDLRAGRAALAEGDAALAKGDAAAASERFAAAATSFDEAAKAAAGR